MNSDQLFGTSGSKVSAANRQRLIEFFTTVDAKSFIINGYTDNRGSARRNVKLSQRRANAVAQIAADANVPLLDVRGYGESSPKASNKTAAGRAENRRVEIICVH
jgi:outer membrane protein OmpA-like peptidoglycan-associated protein